MKKIEHIANLMHCIKHLSLGYNDLSEEDARTIFSGHHWVASSEDIPLIIQAHAWFGRAFLKLFTKENHFTTPLPIDVTIERLQDMLENI